MCLTFLGYRVQRWFVALSARLCEILSSGFHAWPAAPQSFSGELGGTVLGAGMPDLPSHMSDLLWAWRGRVPVLPTPQPPSGHVVSASEPGAAQISNQPSAPQ